MSLLELRSLAGERTGRRDRQAHRQPRRNRDNRAAALFLAPWVVGLTFITIGPVVASLWLSFTEYNLLRPPRFIGLDNYRDMFNDRRFWKSFRVTLRYVGLGVPLQLLVALALALVLNRGMRGLAFYRSVFYLPSLLGGSVAVAIMWRRVFGSEGVVNQFLALFGIEGPGWVSNPATALYSIILLHVWTFGSPMVIFLAGLRQIPEMYYEAASVDGAGRVRMFTSITLPLLTPIIFFNFVLQVIFAFQSFTQAFIVSGGSGGPADSTLFYTLYLYREGFTYLHMGYAAAMAWFLLVVIAFFTAMNFWLSKYWVFYGS